MTNRILKATVEYSAGWLQKGKIRHSVKYLKICGGTASADHEVAELIDEFIKTVADESLATEQIYNADETIVLALLPHKNTNYS